MDIKLSLPLVSSSSLLHVFSYIYLPTRTYLQLATSMRFSFIVFIAELFYNSYIKGSRVRKQIFIFLNYIFFFSCIDVTYSKYLVLVAPRGLALASSWRCCVAACPRRAGRARSRNFRACVGSRAAAANIKGKIVYLSLIHNQWLSHCFIRTQALRCSVCATLTPIAIVAFFPIQLVYVYIYRHIPIYMQHYIQNETDERNVVDDDFSRWAL